MSKAFNYTAWIRGSLDNSPGGASSKKLAAFWVTMFIVTPLVDAWAIWAFIHNDWALFPEILSSLLFFVSAALTIHGAEKIIEKFKPTPKNETPTPTGDPGAV
jgi:hypothetical protein